MNHVYLGDNLPILAGFPDASFNLIYTDPPFNTGVTRTLTRVQAVPSEAGPAGFGGKRYERVPLGSLSYADQYDDYVGWLGPRLVEMRRLLQDTGTLYLHLDPREVHYCKVFLDHLFGRTCFLGEVIWAYDYGGKSKRRWPWKHDNILVYARDPRHYIFNVAAIDRVPYMAPSLVSPEKALRGKLPTDVWWHTIVPTNGKERTGYPTQKPLGIVRRILAASSNPGDATLDPFAGSGTLGEAAGEAGRRFVLIDNNADAVETMRRRFTGRDWAAILYHDNLEDAAA